MKRPILIFILVFFIFHTRLFAQKEIEGVYLSANDFIIGKLSFSNNRPDKRYCLEAKEFLNSPSIRIIKGDSFITLHTDSIFGYRDKNNECFRFYNKRSYRILNPTENLLLYNYNITECLSGNIHNVTSYFFSVNARSPIYPLTIRNLEAAFYKDVHFIELLKEFFSYDDELYAYDRLNMEYFINSIFEESSLEAKQVQYKIHHYESKCAIFNNHIQ